MTGESDSSGKASPCDLTGKVVLVTGAGSGIGRAGAMAMSGAGAHVVISDMVEGLAQSACEEARTQGGLASSLALDVTDDAAVAAAIADVVAEHGRLDVLHSHAGIQIEGRLEDVSAGDMDRSWALNVRSHFVAAKAALTPMRAQGGGSVIITSSNSGVQFDREMICYTTTKHAVIAMTRQMAADYAKDNIRFNALCPGFVDTPFNAGFETQMGGRDALENYIAQAIPMGRWATSGEIADAILFLASDMSTFMTGHALVIDGGECL